MAESTGFAEGFASVDRDALMRLAYRMLGTVEDAEDVVQEAHVKLLTARRPPDNPGAFLFRVVSNLAIDRLRHLKVQRRAYPGPWLPEPREVGAADAVADAASDLDRAASDIDRAASDIDRAAALDTALLVLLERLSAAERVAFVLREACDLDFAEMADVLGVRADACRQRFHRARRKLDGLRRPATPTRDQRRLLRRLSAAVMAGDRDQLTALLSDDAVLLTDGGGRVSAALRPVRTADRIAQVLLHLAAKQTRADMTFEWLALDGGVGLLIRERGAAFACVQLAAAADGARVDRLFVVRNPDKLARLPASGSAGRAARLW